MMTSSHPKPEPKPTSSRASALRMLGRRSYTKQELQDRLRRQGFSDEDILATLEWLSSNMLQSDYAVASGAVRWYGMIQQKGNGWVSQKLRSRGVPSEVIQSVLSQRTEEEERQAALAAGQKILASLGTLPKEMKWRKLGDRLIRRGFSVKIVQYVCQHLLGTGQDVSS